MVYVLARVFIKGLCSARIGQICKDWRYNQQVVAVMTTKTSMAPTAAAVACKVGAKLRLSCTGWFSPMVARVPLSSSDTMLNGTKENRRFTSKTLEQGEKNHNRESLLLFSHPMNATREDKFIGSSKP